MSSEPPDRLPADDPAASIPWELEKTAWDPDNEGQAPRPDLDLRRFVPLFSMLLLAALAVWGFRAARVEIVAYNAFDQGVVVRIDDEEQRLRSGSTAHFTVWAGKTRFQAEFRSESEPFETFEFDLTRHGSDSVIYNIGRRGVFAFETVSWGEPVPLPALEYLAGRSIFTLDPPADYLFEQPPNEMPVPEGETISKTLVEPYFPDSEAIDDVIILLEKAKLDPRYFEIAREVGLAELRLHPDNAAVAQRVALTLPDLAARRELFRGLLERAPDAIELHRAYQDLWPIDALRADRHAWRDVPGWRQETSRPSGDTEALIDEYRELLESQPTSALHQYLLGRIVGPEGSRAHFDRALELDPDLSLVHRSLAYRSLALRAVDQQGDATTARVHLERYAAFGPAEVLEVFELRLRLSRRAGTDSAAHLALIDEAMAAAEAAGAAPHEIFAIERLRVHSLVEAQPAQLEQAMIALGIAAETRLGLEANQPAQAGLLADLAVSAGHLDRALQEFECSPGPDEPVTAALRFLLSGGEVADRSELLDGKGWTVSLSDGWLLAALAIPEADEARLSALTFRQAAAADLAEIFRDVDAVASRPIVDEAIARLAVEDRALAYWAASHWAGSRRLDPSESERAAYQSSARAFSLPGELPPRSPSLFPLSPGGPSHDA